MKIGPRRKVEGVQPVTKSQRGIGRDGRHGGEEPPTLRQKSIKEMHELFKREHIKPGETFVEFFDLEGHQVMIKKMPDGTFRQVAFIEGSIVNIPYVPSPKEKMQEQKPVPKKSWWKFW